MALPGTQIISRDSSPPRSAPTDTGVWFVAGFTEKGPTTPTLITSLAQFIAHFGARVSYSVLYDAVETFFREGGGKLIVNRVVGPSSLNAFLILQDGAAANALKVEALTPGTWGNALKVQVAAGSGGGTFVLVVSDASGELERSGDLADQTAAIAWASTSQYIRLTAQASSNDPAVLAATNLASGTDDHASATDASWKTAIDGAGKDLGPGQVSYPGRTTDQAHTDLLAHAASHNRVAILDAQDTASASTLRTSAAALRGGVNDRFGALFAPWVVVPGLTPGTTRTVPYSAVEAGILARNDGLGRSVNEPGAGSNGQSRFAIDLSQPAWSDVDRESLNDAGVNVARLVYGGIRTYGYRTLADPLLKATWVDFGNSRLYMKIAAEGDAISERFVFAQLDGRGRKIAEYGGVLTGMLVPFYEQGALYGETPEQAFAVDVGPQVNTPDTIANRELHAVLSLRMSPFAELVILELVKVATEEAIA